MLSLSKVNLAKRLIVNYTEVSRNLARLQKNPPPPLSVNIAGHSALRVIKYGGVDVNGEPQTSLRNLVITSLTLELDNIKAQLVNLGIDPEK